MAAVTNGGMTNGGATIGGMTNGGATIGGMNLGLSRGPLESTIAGL